VVENNSGPMPSTFKSRRSSNTTATSSYTNYTVSNSFSFVTSSSIITVALDDGRFTQQLYSLEVESATWSDDRLLFTIKSSIEKISLNHLAPITCWEFLLL
jgi:hypothetical protein